MNQSEMIYDYNLNNRPKFNRELFVRNDNDIINAIKDVIYSCQRESTFIIRVLEFEVIDTSTNEVILNNIKLGNN